MALRILIANARLDDVAAMDTLFEQVPDGPLLRQAFETGESGRTYRYFAKLRNAIYLVSVGQILLCFTVTELTADQAAAIAVQCEPTSSWSAAAFERAVERALGGKSVRPN